MRHLKCTETNTDVIMYIMYKTDKAFFVMLEQYG